MDPAALVLFADIVESGNLSQAARKLRMSRANISYHLGRLEQAAGQQLMRRTTRRIEVTEVGLRLYEHGRVIRNEWQAAREVVATAGQHPQGAVRLSMPTGFGQLVMSDWLIDFKRQYPDIALNLLFDNRVDDLLRDEVDIAIRVLSAPPEPMVATELGPVRYVACAARGYAGRAPMPIAPADLRDSPLITSAVVGRHLRVVATRATERHELSLQPTLASENFQFLREAILAGLGLGVVPDYVVADDAAAGRVTTFLDDWRLHIFGSRLFLLRMPDRYRTLATRTLTDFIVQRARDWSGFSGGGGLAGATLPGPVLRPAASPAR